MKEENIWHKVSKNVPMEYAATITVNPLTALLMLEDIVKLKSGTFRLYSFCVSVYVFLFFFFWLFPDCSPGLIGDTIVQNGATSIVGQCVIQLAKVKGINNVNIIRDRCRIVFLPFVLPYNYEVYFNLTINHVNFWV